MPTPGPQFQPVLPGMGLMSRRPARNAAAPVTPRPTNSGPMTGQLVMGVRDLARGREVDHGWDRVPSSKMPGANRLVSRGTTEEHYEVDQHGYVQEGFGQAPHHDEYGGGVHGGHTHAAELYGTHGGRFANTLREAATKEGGSLTDWGITAHTAAVHDRQVKEVKQHWNSQPLVQFPTSQIVHSTQQHDETEGEPEMTRARTAGGTTRREKLAPDVAGRRPREPITAWTERPGSGEGRQRIEAIKGDLAKGGKIRTPIWMTKVNGRYFQLDGHHRMVAAREMGLSHVPVRLWDQDAERG